MTKAEFLQMAINAQLPILDALHQLTPGEVADVATLRNKGR